MNSKVTIIDVGVSNLFNVQRGFEKIGATVQITRDPKEILSASRVVLPGVGAFGSAIKNLEQSELIPVIHEYAKTGKPLFGICLGMQLLLSESQELGTWKGLNLIPGKVIRLESPRTQSDKFKIPEICWNSLFPPQSVKAWENTVLQGIAAESYVYFVHSFHCVPEDSKHALATTKYGHNEFVSVVKKDNISGCQFHPERSGGIGLQILKNFMHQE